ncbi:AAA family ATPase [Acetobacterium fimetarium]|uniref:AAA family ATPase n=1 Tax=Acetobacterium fimetarium TaxID=52691 RepID=A0ABR6WRX5_9FIRM|nr:ATP-binding protein [Acetobacterium fimetarium]MBC3803349.1 AAA family ATPase [Acetobacterium fimetarium]
MDAFDLIPKLVRSSLECDRKTIEATALMIAKKIKKERPEIAIEITKALSYSGYRGSMARSIDLQPLPVDKESRYSLVKVEEPIESMEPILNEYTRRQLDDFISERKILDKFLEEDIIPPNSILLDGLPGVGKTYIAKWMSYQLNLPLVTLDLASSISSYLGRSGQNIRSIFEYATSQNAILFLDELDAIAKRRDDAGDLGELKRLVNVLLKELEACPSSCVIIGATNHPELLDKAIWRRFDRSLTISMPGEEERKKLLVRHLGKFVKEINKETLEYLAQNTKEINSADICKLSEHIKRQILLNSNTPKTFIALSELFKIVQLGTREDKVKLCRRLKKDFTQLSLREISQITQIPLTSVSRYLTTNKEENNG